MRMAYGCTNTGKYASTHHSGAVVSASPLDDRGSVSSRVLSEDPYIEASDREWGIPSRSIAAASLEQQRWSNPPLHSIVIESLDLVSSTPTPLAPVDDTIGAHHLRCPQPTPPLQSRPLVLLRCPIFVPDRNRYPPPSLLCCSPPLSLLSPAPASFSSSPIDAIHTMLLYCQNCRSIAVVASLLLAKFYHIWYSTQKFLMRPFSRYLLRTTVVGTTSADRTLVLYLLSIFVCRSHWSQAPCCLVASSSSIVARLRFPSVLTVALSKATCSLSSLMLFYRIPLPHYGLLH
ncbi:hypothetical protein B296_00043365 [Ensete ventricosum]|uniref:Uncharacterized protein n=1 Tax=Ensete ventricosum TaxID=4639 RepID=A0A426YMN7_ENSVE|nr:hypothetical protein B296_00043365 [Ensete ventricosum]